MDVESGNEKKGERVSRAMNGEQDVMNKKLEEQITNIVRKMRVRPMKTSCGGDRKK